MEYVHVKHKQAFEVGMVDRCVASEIDWARSINQGKEQGTYIGQAWVTVHSANMSEVTVWDAERASMLVRPTFELEGAASATNSNVCRRTRTSS